MASYTQLLKQVKQAISKSAEAGLSVSKNAPVYQRPNSETWVRAHATWHPTGYYRVFCAHDKLWIEPCQQCRRTSTEAKASSLYK